MADLPFPLLNSYAIKHTQLQHIKYGEKSLRELGSHIWNSLHENVKYKTAMNIFKGSIKFGPKFKCLICYISLLNV